MLPHKIDCKIHYISFRVVTQHRSTYISSDWHYTRQCYILFDFSFERRALHHKTMNNKENVLASLTL
jgi:hypothetical protein